MKKKCVLKRKIAVVCLVAVVVYVFFSASGMAVDAGGEYFSFSVSNCSYAAIDECVRCGYFDDLCSVEKDSSGKVALIRTNAVALNALSVRLANDCYDRLERLTSDGFSVPSGVFTGIRLLSGSGKKVRIKLNSVLSVQCDMVREVISSGINQSRITLTAVIRADISVYTLLAHKSYVGKIEVPVFDDFIVGAVPSVYLSSEIVGSCRKGE